MSERDHFIAGRWEAGTGPRREKKDPADGETILEFREGQSDEVNRALRAARQALPGWSAPDFSCRREILEGYARLLEEKKDEMAECISRETGKPRWESLQEVGAMKGKVAISIGAFQERTGERITEGAPVKSALRFRPRGVVAVFGPFNFPGHLPGGHFVPALLAGNCIVFKPSEQSPATGQKIAEYFELAGIPPGVFNLVQGGRETGAELLRSDEADAFFFTGSYEGGRALHRALAGRPEKLLVLEMGGNNPLVVHETGNLQAAAVMAVESAFITTGQRCSCARRLIVPRGAAGDRFVELFLNLSAKLRPGRWDEEPPPFMGPVISVRAADRLLEGQDELRRAGGTILLEMKRPQPDGAFLSPGVIDVTAIERRIDCEYFGPLLQLVRPVDFEAALEEANRTAYGLSAGLISDRRELYDHFRAVIRAGVVNWNRKITGASSALPFGGMGRSGNHRPAAYFAADFCSHPVASLESEIALLPESLPPGMPPVAEWS